MENEHFLILCEQNKNLAEMLSLLNERLDILNDAMAKQNSVMLNILSAALKKDSEA